MLSAETDTTELQVSVHRILSADTGAFRRAPALFFFRILGTSRSYLWRLGAGVGLVHTGEEGAENTVSANC